MAYVLGSQRQTLNTEDLQNKLNFLQTYIDTIKNEVNAVETVANQNNDTIGQVLTDIQGTQTSLNGFQSQLDEWTDEDKQVFKHYHNTVNYSGNFLNIDTGSNFKTVFEFQFTRQKLTSEVLVMLNFQLKVDNIAKDVEFYIVESNSGSSSPSNKIHHTGGTFEDNVMTTFQTTSLNNFNSLNLNFQVLIRGRNTYQQGSIEIKYYSYNCLEITS